MNNMILNNGEFVIHYFNFWLEKNEFLNIQMELCSDNLKNIIEKKKEFFEREDFESMTNIEYFISCRLYEEILDGVKFLHHLKPPIVHRNLSLENILVKKIPKNGRFVKIGNIEASLFEIQPENSNAYHVDAEQCVDLMRPLFNTFNIL